MAQHDSLRVALALEVGDSAVAATRRADGSVDAAWTGTIHYPGWDVAFAAPLPSLSGPKILRVSEAVFCGMQVDGAMAPYALTFRWTLPAADPRLRAPLSEQAEQGWFEALLGLAARWSGAW